MAKYSQEVAEKIDALVPEEVRRALHQFGWNELGVYEAVKQAIAEVKKSGGKIFKT